VFLSLLAERLGDAGPDQVAAAIAEIGAVPLALAALATAVSFLAVAGYDLAWHRYLCTGVEPYRAHRAGFAAIAIGQTVGFGIFSGALVRWRMLPELGLMAATRLSVLVAVSFLLAWAVLTSVCLLVLPDAPFVGIAPYGLGLAILGLCAGLAAAGEAMPNLFTIGRLGGLAAVDCLAAGLALWALIPGDVALVVFLPAFLLALGAGLLSGAPAGLGAFEIVFLALLPGEADLVLLAGVVTWRLIYFALPALAGAGAAIWVGTRPALPQQSVGLSPVPIAEAGLVAQGDLFQHPEGFVAGRTAHALVALAAVPDLQRFCKAARDEARWPVVYKLSGRRAVVARRAGLRVLVVAREAWLDPQSFRLEIPARAGLRRKLRRAKAAGVCARVETMPDWARLSRINAAWVATRGQERGFTMGRFDSAYLQRQVIVIARQNGAEVGFASFHVARIGDEVVWTLDLLRPDPAAAEGTAQALVLAGLEAAQAAGVRHLSLAAVPVGADAANTGAIARLGRLVASDGVRGLDQFKSAFAPRWQRLYIAAPSALALLVAGIEIWRRVVRPVRLARLNAKPARLADYEIASDRNPWQREEDRLA
jgi:phosphatidylglycerol lysyltransferase